MTNWPRTLHGRHRRACLLALALLPLVLSSCAQLRTPQGVTIARHVLTDPGPDGPDTRKEAPGPAPGASPERVVRGFIAAEANDDDQHRVARQFLAPKATWAPEAGVLVYDPSSLDVAAAPGARQRASSATIAEISPGGGYTPRTAPVTFTFSLVKVSGQWRLASVPQGLWLTQQDLDRSYRPVSLWFLTPSGAALVPDPVLLPVTRTALPSALIRALLTGPSPSLARVVRTAVPAGTTLLGSAAVVDGVIGIDLSGEADLPAGGQVRDLLAQIGATVSQLSAVSAMRVTAGGRPLTGGRGTALQTPAQAVGTSDVDRGGPIPDAALVLAGDHLALVRIRGDQPGATTRQVALGPGRIDDAALSDSTHVAVVRQTSSGRRLELGSLTSLRVAGPLPEAHSLAFGPNNELWGVAAGGVVTIAPNGTTTRVRLPLPAAFPVQSIRVSRDGARVAVIAGLVGHRHLLVGPVSRIGGVTVLSLTDVAPGLSDVLDVTFAEGIRLDVLAVGTTGHGVRVWQLNLDGEGLTQVSSAGLPAAPTAIAAPRRGPALVAAGGQVWELTTGWVALLAGTRPVYPA